MKQVLQPVSRGGVIVADVPAPQVRDAGVLVRTSASLISSGTERASLEFAGRSLVGKARNRPDLVRQVLDKIKRDGFLQAAAAIRARLDEPVPLGYSCAGIVVAAGSAVGDLRVGDYVACAGAGYAGHAEVNYVPRNLTVPVPRRAGGDWVAPEEACFATLGAIALHAVRLSRTAIGERVAVIGCGLIGLLAGQILRAQGSLVVGIEPSARRRERAKDLGFDEVFAPDEARDGVAAFTRGVGADAVVIAASSSDSGPVAMAGDLARDRATVVVIGTTGLEVPRRSYYHKELSFVVSRSYGPGRYDRAFEEHGHDYPAGYVRWTERENLRAFLDLVATDRVSVRPLITNRVDIEHAAVAYEALNDPDTMAIVLRYPQSESESERPARAETRSGRIDIRTQASPVAGAVGVSLIGAGSFARATLLPALRKIPGIEFRGVVSGGGPGAQGTADRFGFQYCASDVAAIWEDDRSDVVVVATRHHLHAEIVRAALAAGKHVFVEKPLALTAGDVESIVEAYRASVSAGRAPLVGIGFNRRFAPSVQAVRAFLGGTIGPLTIVYRVNLGPLPKGHWVADPIEGGGRILSEGCHFVDLATYLTRSVATSVFASGRSGANPDAAITITCENGSVATIALSAGGDRSYSKERIEVMGGGRVAVIDDFRRSWLVSDGRTRRHGGIWARKEKGHSELLAAFIAAVRDGAPAPIPFDEIINSTRATLAVEESLRQGSAVAVEEVR